MGDNLEYTIVKEHTVKVKYNILRKYFEACMKFQKKYNNFAYVDTHGGSGKVKYVSRDGSQIIDGSALIAANAGLGFHCHLVEIDDNKFRTLRIVMYGYDNVSLYHDDCNEVIDDILNKIPRGKRFVFCFVDPDRLIYEGKHKGRTVKKHQLKWDTVLKICNFPRSEILVNIPLEAIMRVKGALKENYQPKLAENLDVFFGNHEWVDIEPGDYKGFLDLYLKNISPFYEFVGAILVTTLDKRRAPLYYLVYGTNNHIGAKIMRDIMSKEWIDLLGYRPIDLVAIYNNKKTKWLNDKYPINRFVFH